MQKRIDVHQRHNIADIAVAAGVSIATVSRVLNQRPDVSSETRDRVLRLIAERGYVSNRTTHSTKETATKLIDLIISGPLDSEYYLEVVRGLDESLNRIGRRLALFTMHNEQRLVEDWQANVAQRCPEGVLLLAPGEQFIYVETLRKLHIPFVAVDDSRELGPDVPSVGATNWRGGMMATEYLLSLGHRRIATISGIPSHLTSKARVAGYRSALEAASIVPESELIRQGDFGHTSGYSQALALLALAEPPTAIVAGCDIQATGIYRALSEHGMHIPRDMSIIGFDDIPSTEWMSPPLTTIRQPLREMGSIAVDLLLQQIAGEPLKSLRVELATSLIVRQSCTPRD